MPTELLDLATITEDERQTQLPSPARPPSRKNEVQYETRETPLLDTAMKKEDELHTGVLFSVPT